MKNIVIFVLIITVIVIGVLVILSFDSISLMENNDSSSEPILGDKEKDSTDNQKDPGRDLSIELDEKMGFSAP